MDESLDLPKAGYNELLGVVVREHRNRRSMTQEFLSKEAGVSMRYLVQIEKEGRNLSINKLRAIAESLDTTVSSLTSEVESLQKSQESSKSHDAHSACNSAQSWTTQ